MYSAIEETCTWKV